MDFESIAPMAIGWVVGVAAISFIVGFGIAYLVARSGRMQGGKMSELKDELAAAQEEMTSYKQEVFGQFAQTAEHFRDLDKSYHALHAHLAASSVALCGDQATPLLAHDDSVENVASEEVVSEIEGQVEDATDAETEAEAEIESAAEAEVTESNVEIDDTNADVEIQAEGSGEADLPKTDLPETDFTETVSAQDDAETATVDDSNANLNAEPIVVAEQEKEQQNAQQNDQSNSASDDVSPAEAPAGDDVKDQDRAESSRIKELSKISS